MSMLFWLVASHFVCDYPLQSEFIAVGKNPAKSPHNGVPWYWIMAGHAFTHGAGVALVTGSTALGMAETVLHFFIDWLKCKGHTTIGQDQLLHIDCKLLWFTLVLMQVA